MLDENLPTFFLKPASDDTKHHSTLYLSYHGSEPEPAYALRHADPSLEASKNTYSVALCDSYIPDIIFAEILLQPEWSQPTLSAEEIRRNGGVPPPPHPATPKEFAIQLYNPDQQVHVKQQHGSWNSSAYWEFEMPQHTFRQPSVSSLDRSQSDPAVAATTPKLVFRWKRDGKLSKDLICYLCGKNTNPDGSKRKGSREPDIAIALFKSLKEVTVYEPNLYRVDMEDPKGLEVVILLSAVAIRDVFFASNMREVFNLPPQRQSSLPGRKHSSPTAGRGSGAAAPWLPPPPPSRPIQQQPAAIIGLYGQPKPSQNPQHPSNQPPPRHQTPNPAATTGPPPADPLTQWQIDSDTARLRKQAEKEKAAREKAEAAELKRIRKMVEAEEKEQRRKDAEIAKETERLRKMVEKEQRQASGVKWAPQPPMPPRTAPPRQQMGVPYLQTPVPYQRPASVPYHHHSGSWSQPQSRPQHAGPYLHPPNAAPAASMSGFFGGGGLLKPDNGQRLSGGRGRRKSLLGLNSLSGGGTEGGKLHKKKSSMF